MKKGLAIIISAMLLFALSACGSIGSADLPQTSESLPTTESNPSQTDVQSSQSENTEDSSTVVKEQNAIGAMTPEEALEYMKEADNLVIVDVAATQWYDQNHFEGAINIPIEELDSEEEDELYMQIPSDRPVLMHCRRGMIVPGAYERVLELRSDIPEIAYIDGVPLFDEYNEWLNNQ